MVVSQSVSVEQVVEQAIVQVLADRGKPCPQIGADALLMSEGLGMDSLDFSVLVICLEDQLGSDPFVSGEVVRFPNTVGDLIALYEQGH